jgi:hypothetical protein
MLIISSDSSKQLVPTSLAQFQIEVTEKSRWDWQENVEFGVKKRRKIGN